MMMRRTEEGALKCAFLDLRREDARAVKYTVSQRIPSQVPGDQFHMFGFPRKPAAGEYHTGVELGHFVNVGVAGVGVVCRGGPRGVDCREICVRRRRVSCCVV